MDSNNPIIINFAPTGMVPQKDVTPHVPIQPAEIIEQTHEAYEMGITIAHLHAREIDGTPTHKVSVYRDIFEGVRKHCPNLVISASLSGRKVQEVEMRAEVLQLKPDMGSLTLSSLNFSRQASQNSPEVIIGLIEQMDKHGVHPELECFDAGMINYSKYLIKKKLLKAPYYYNILCGNVATAQADLSYLGLMIRDLPEESLWALAGIGLDQLKINTIAIAAGGGVRVGLEDNIWFDSNKSTLATNIDLIKRIHEIANISGRPIMSPETFGGMGFYNKWRNQ
ncbi:3-keto-5-aminohexanoate cleavage protein [Ekhidna sp.]|uniref:3-keto-5-aminohexanoate cleavage protein n=1 Tax=Ekhidna sp. TaxID=2608089 RepID=UPI003B58C2F0